MVKNVWIRELRAPFLLLSLIFVSLGTAIAWIHGAFDPLVTVLTLVGVLSLHMSVNVLNDYFDYRSGIDIITTPTPFSGGSRILPSKELRAGSVLAAGLLFLIIGAGTGIYFLSRFAFNPLLIGILAISLISVLGYSFLFAKWGLGEFIAGLNFGPFMLLGTYYVQTGTISLEPIIIGLILGILTAGILYINEFPDTQADMQMGRMHLVARWGKATAASRFKFLIASAYVIVILGVITSAITPFALISLLTIPKARFAVKHLGQNYDKSMELVPGMANMVMATLWTGGLLFIGYLVSGFFHLFPV
jgi:1,4-dihydroxy-2-naphthoate octaprenyltransferase